MAEQLSEDPRAAFYRDQLAPEAFERMKAGESWADVHADLLEYLEEINYGLTLDEIDQVIGSRDEETRAHRWQRLETACRAIILKSSLMFSTPAEALRLPRPLPRSEMSWLDRLATGHPNDFAIMINELDLAYPEGPPGPHAE